MPMYTVYVKWEMEGFHKIEADDLLAAEAEAQTMDPPANGTLIAGSLTIEEEE